MSIFAILSDTHDQISHLNAAVDYANKVGADVMIHCGDLISAFMLHRLANFLGRVHLIYGNNVGDTHTIIPRCFKQFPEITHHGVYGSFNEGVLSVALVHYPKFATTLALSGLYDIVCCGHTHKYKVDIVHNKKGRTLLINPGSMLGENDDTGFVLVDTKNTKKIEKWTLQRVNIGDCIFDTPVRVQAQDEVCLQEKRATSKMGQ